MKHDIENYIVLELHSLNYLLKLKIACQNIEMKSAVSQILK